ncbi:hypothetical protein ACJRO7_004623 [Eucalyptus globulus]|uniref:Uncharacterized protein n=1 Tax=Eucalyptus globulus TaxID=34317 RepID=A0ABD3IXN4_EUCGL
MNTPLLCPRTETCGTPESCRIMLPLPPPLHPDETKWIVHVDKSLKCVPADRQQYWKRPSIYRVPAFITNLNWKAYQPQVVSFGPYHYGEIHLGQMQEHKHRVLLHFLERSGKTLKRFLSSLRKVARDLEEMYDTLDPKWMEGGGGRFLELMMMDGCFMLEIMRTTIEEKHGYSANDPIFSTSRLAYLKPYIRRDMLMLENQLPMLVLYELVAIESDYTMDDEYVNKLVLKFCSPSMRIARMGMGKCLHVVDVFRKGQLTDTAKVRYEPEHVELKAAVETEQIIRSATELNVIGIRFRKSPTSSRKDISFAGGVLSLPVFKVTDTTESEFLNLMTFERLYIETGNEITAYITFMDNIINGEQDVALLHAQGIIQNGLGSNKAVAKLINSLCKEVPLTSNKSLDVVQKNISKYCTKHWHRWWANLIHTYFQSPWSVLSLIAAIFLFALTAVQTAYTVLSYN